MFDVLLVFQTHTLYLYGEMWEYFHINLSILALTDLKRVWKKYVILLDSNNGNRGNKQLAECFWSGQNDKNPPYFVGIAVVSFAPYATFLFSWDYAIIIADKSCLLPWHQIDARGALKLAFPLQKSSFHANCLGFNPFVSDFTVFEMFIFYVVSSPSFPSRKSFSPVLFATICHPYLMCSQQM